MRSLLIGAFFLLYCTTFSQTTYYSKAAGNLNTLATWGTNTNGSGTAPANFTTANCTYIIVNNAAPTISGNWTVSGANSRVLVGDGVQVINFTVPSPRTTTATYSVMVGSTLTANNGSTISASTVHVNGTFSNAAANNPTLGTLAAGSTVNYSRAGAQTVVNAAYGNLTLSGSGTKTLSNTANTSVAGVLNIGAGIPFQLNTNTARTLTLNGTLAGAGTMTGGANTNLSIGGSGAFGTIIPSASPLTLRNLIINRAALGTVTMGGNITVGTTFTHSNGVLVLNGNTLTLNGATTFPLASANGSISGSATSNLSISATSAINTLSFTAGAQTLNNFTLNSGAVGIQLGTNLTVSGAFTHTTGILNLTGVALTLNGTATFPTSAANGTLSGSGASDLFVNTSAITNSLFMTTGVQTLRNLTINSSGQNFTLGTNLSVTGAYTHTAGILLLNGQTLTLNGTIVFPASSANGTTTGSTTSNLAVAATSITNPLVFTAAAQTLNNLTINCGAQTLNLGSALTVSGAFTHTNGILGINANTLTLSGTITFPASAANGTMTGSASSNLSVSATSITNSVYFTAGAQTLNNLTLNCTTQSFRLGTGLTIGGAYTQTTGIMDLNGNTLTLNGTITFSNSAANGTTTGSATSNLIINATNIANNNFFMTAGARQLNNFTLNCSVNRNFRMGTAMTVSGAYTHTRGIMRLNNQTLTLSGTVTFPASSALGTTRGSNTSNLNVSASSITNLLRFTTGATALRNLTLNSPGQTLALGTALTLSGALNHTAGILQVTTATLTLNGAITFPVTSANGTLSGSSVSSISVGGAGTITNTMKMTQSGTFNYLNNFLMNRAARTVTLGNTLNIVGALTPTTGTVAAGGNLILKATSSTSVGRIATMGNTGAVSGNVIAQMYAKGGNTGWTTLGSPGLTGRTFADWDDNTTITCTLCPDGYFNFTSAYQYSETVGGLYSNPARYVPIANITDAITIGRGYWFYLGTSTTTSADILLDATGAVNQQNFPITLTQTNTGGGTQANDHGFNLLCNPYPSPISWTLLRNGNANVANSIYVYNPDISGHASYVNGVSSPAPGSGGIANFIPAGQGFFVKANAAVVNLTARETNKAASTQELRRLIGQQQTLSTTNPMVLRLEVNGHAMKFETAVYFDPGATVNHDDEYDAGYLGPDAGYLGICTQLNGNEYAINGMPALNQNYSIPVRVHTDSSDSYSITANDLQNLPSGACVILHDNYTGLDQDLRLGSYTCTVLDTEKVAARFVLNITIDPSLNLTSSFVNPSCSNLADGMLIASGSGIGPWNYYWKDSSNTIVKTSLNKITADTLFNLGPGIYSVDVNTAGSCDNGTASFTLNSTNVPQAGYTPSASTLTFIMDSVGVTFTNTSVNATSYWWDFGDGMGSECFDTTYQYSAPGEYTVTLAAIGPCGDTTYYSEVITVIDGSAVGITDVAAPSEQMFISRDVNGFYVQFTGKENTGAHISVQNILGEKVIADQYLPHVSHQKSYIPFGDTNEKILIISVVTDSGEKTYCKIINY